MTFRAALCGAVKVILSFFHHEADLHAVIDTEKERVIPAALASDDTAVKPGLEFDPRQKVIIGLVYKVDAAHVSTYRHPDPEEIKKNLLTSADVSYLTSLDNGASMPVAVHFVQNQ